MTPRLQCATKRIRVVAAFLIVGLAAGPAASHLYWLLGGTWGLHRPRGATSTRKWRRTGTRIVAAVVIVLLVAAVLVVLARVGLWQQAFVSDRVIWFFAWALAAVFLVETWQPSPGVGTTELWWMYGPVSLVIAALALVVAGSGGAWPRSHRPHRTRPSD